VEYNTKLFSVDESIVDDPTTTTECGVHVYPIDWRERSRTWFDKLRNDPHERPYAQQLQILEAVRDRCEYECRYEHRRDGWERIEGQALLRLVHGLPGSGKTKVMLWLRDYFESVWNWEAGTHFVFLAPLNTMAANISGATLHSFGEIRFKDRRGNLIQGKRRQQDDVSSMHIKCSSLRFLLIDEIEATGAEVLADLEETVRSHAPRAFRKQSVADYECPFGGVSQPSLALLYCGPL